MALKRVATPSKPVNPRPAPRGLASREQLEHELIEQVFLLQTLMDTIPDSIYFKDKDSRFTRVNRYGAARLGLNEPSQALGKTDFNFFTDEHAQQAFRDEQEIVRTGHPLVGIEEKETLPDGKIRWVSTTKMPLRDMEGRIIGTFGISRDISDRKRIEAQLERRAFYDPLTKLPNRALFTNRLEHLFRRSKRRGAGVKEKEALFATVYLDIDQFKGVNDSMGHHAGDELLVQFARRLEACVRPGDTLARLGGDEFTVLLEEIRSEADATRVAERIHGDLASGPFSVQGAEIFCSASVGIALSSSGYSRAEEMLRDADTAMYRAKANGRARHEVFDADMHRRAVTQLSLETDLRRALERREYVLHYQPVIDLEARRMTGFEALVRWKHPKRGLVPPDVFIPIAEDTGIIQSLGLWVLREACRQARDWQGRFANLAPLSIAVNVSTRQLAHPDFLAQVLAVLKETDLDAPSLTLEITESALMQNVKAGAALIQRLRDAGIKLHIDDFGTGYSSLSYLHTFPVDTLKIDRSFVNRLRTDPAQMEIVRAIIALARSFGMDVTAEGVETADQVAALRALNCKSAQGYFFARPLPADEAERLMVSGLPAF